VLLNTARGKPGQYQRIYDVDGVQAVMQVSRLTSSTGIGARALGLQAIVIAFVLFLVVGGDCLCECGGSLHRCPVVAGVACEWERVLQAAPHASVEGPRCRPGATGSAGRQRRQPQDVCECFDGSSCVRSGVVACCGCATLFNGGVLGCVRSTGQGGCVSFGSLCARGCMEHVRLAILAPDEPTFTSTHPETDGTRVAYVRLCSVRVSGLSRWVCVVWPRL
jgi:hypothetical protein